MEQCNQQIKIERQLYEQEQLHNELEYHKYKKHVIKNAIKKFQKCKPKTVLKKTIPALDWLSHYKWKEYLTGDIIAGITVAIMQIPQGMAYGLLGNVSPIVGMYMAFFPVLVYFFLGTSRHNSIGTFAVVCLMAGKVVSEHSDPSYFQHSKSFDQNFTNNDVYATINPSYSPIEVATTLTFTVAMFQILMYIFRLGIVGSLLSETLVSGFTTGAAIHVLTSQVKDLFGYKIPKHKGLFLVVKTYISIFEEILNPNYVAMVISAVTIIISVFNNEVIKPKLAKKCSFPVPIELIAIIMGTIVSTCFNISENYDVIIIGEIPSGLPLPTIPKFSLMGAIMVDGFIIAVVSYTVNLSMALIFAQKLGYEVDANQELLALGTGNIVGSIFSCMPTTASLSRSLIQQTTGGKTQVASLASSAIIFVVLMWIGPYFQALPQCILASVVIVALKGMIFQVKDFFQFWKLSKMDAAVWLITFLSVVLISIDIGLLIGIIMSLLTILLLGMKPYTCLLGSVPHTDLYLDINRYKGAEEIPGLKIFHYQGGINFASRNYFKSELCRLIEIKPQKEFIWRKKLIKLSCLEESDLPSEELKKIKIKEDKLKSKTNQNIKCVILDFSALSYVDPSGVSMLKLLAETFRRIDIPLYIAGCSAPVYEMMTKCELIDIKKNSFRIFPTTHDAVQCAKCIFCENINTISTISNC